MNASGFQVLKGLVLVLVTIAWAIAAHVGSTGGGNPDLNVAVCVAPAALACWALLARVPRGQALAGGMLLLAVLAAIWPLLRERVAFLYFLQQVGINLALASLFGRTLRGTGDALVTQLARRIGGPELSARNVRYTRQVTLAWTLFFLANASVSGLLYTLATPAVWSVYANLLGMPLVAAMFVGEHCCRMLVLPRAERPSLVAVVRAWRAHESRSRA